MFCKNCGETLNDSQAICLKCGVKVGEGNKYCASCGNEVNEGAAVCLKCGSALATTSKKGLNGKDKATVALLCFFLGGIGVHNFYMGEKKKGIMKIVFSLLCGLGGILALVDFIKILMDNYKFDPDASF